MISGYNALRLVALNGSTSVPYAGLSAAQGVTFSTVYPGGLFAACDFYVPGIDIETWPLKVNYKLIVYNGLAVVWEGQVTGIEIDRQANSDGVRVSALGYWASVLMRRKWRKWWADTRLGEDVWVWYTAAASAEKCTYDRENRLMFVPKAVAWTSGQGAQFYYTAPTGETVKRITFDYDLQEGAQAWELRMTNGAGGLLWSVAASGTGSVDHTLVTPDQIIRFQFYPAANQTPAADGTIYGKFTNIVVYSETGSITLTEIAKDIRGDVTELSAGETLIASNALSLVPLISEIDTYADILTICASYGDSSYNAWACGIRESDLSTDGKPIVFVEQQPALTDYDYVVRLDDANLTAPFTAEQDVSEVRNWIAVKYQDGNNRSVIVTPDDDANLKDTTSITAYGEIHEWIDVQTTSLTNAKNYARRILAARKDPQWRVSSGITVAGYIRGKGNQIIPASEIHAGKRVKVENFINDLSGTGLTLLITGTSYSDDNETNRLSVGRPDVLAVWLARR